MCQSPQGGWEAVRWGVGIDHAWPHLQPWGIGEQVLSHFPGEETEPREVKVLAQGHTASQPRAGPRPGVHASPPIAPHPPSSGLSPKPTFLRNVPLRRRSAFSSASGLPQPALGRVPSSFTPPFSGGHQTTASNMLKEFLGELSLLAELEAWGQPLGQPPIRKMGGT